MTQIPGSEGSPKRDNIASQNYELGGEDVRSSLLHAAASHSPGSLRECLSLPLGFCFLRNES